MIIAFLSAFLLSVALAGGPAEDLIGTVVMRKILLGESNFFRLPSDEREASLTLALQQAKHELGALKLSPDTEREIKNDVIHLLHDVRGEIMKLDLIPEDKAQLRDDHSFQKEWVLECDKALQVSLPLSDSQKLQLLQIRDHLMAAFLSKAEIKTTLDYEALEELRKSYESQGQIQELIWLYRRTGLTEKASTLENKLAERLMNGTVYSKERSPVGTTQPFFLRLENNLIGVFKTAAPHAEIAAYKLDRLLGLNIVPLTVPRTLEGKRGSVQAYIQNSQTANETQIPWIRCLKPRRGAAPGVSEAAQEVY